MYKEKIFNKIIITVLIISMLLTGLILILGQKSTPRITNYIVAGLDNNIVPLKIQITLNFNRIMDTQSVENNFLLSPKIDGNFAWSGKNMTFTPKSKLEYDQQYSLNIKNAKDSEGNLMTQEFSINFQTRQSKIYFISTEKDQEDFLVEYTLKTKTKNVLVNRPISLYSFSQDGNTVVYTTKETNSLSGKLFIKDLKNNVEKEIKIPNNLFDKKDTKIKFDKLIFGKNYIAILAKGILENGENISFVSDNKIYLYDFSTTEFTEFLPKNKILNTDTMLFTPDFLNLMYRDESQNYSYASLSGGEPVILGKYISINGFNASQDKLAITDSDPLTPEFQYVAYVGNDRQTVILSDTQNYAIDASFANISDKIAYASREGSYHDFDLYGVVVNNLTTKETKTLYFDKNYSIGLPRFSSDDKNIVFERYTLPELESSIYDNRVIFNTVRPKYGEILSVDVSTSTITLITDNGKDPTFN